MNETLGMNDRRSSGAAIETTGPVRARSVAQRRKTVLRVLLLVALVMLAGCQENLRHQGKGVPLTRPIATVNNEKITYEEFQDAYQLFLTRWDRFIRNDAGNKQEIKELLLERMIDELLLDQEARRRGISVEANEFSALTLELLSSGEDNTPAQNSGLLERNEMGEWSRKLQRRMIHTKLVLQEVIDKIRPSPAELRRYYDQHRDSFMRPERVKVRHIAVGSRSLHRKVMNLLERNTPIEELVRTYSITPDREQGGVIGYVERGILPKEFDEAIFALEQVGQVTSAREPVTTQMGFHIFRLEGREEEGLLSFRKALPEVRLRIAQERETQAYDNWLAGLRAKATIHIDRQLLEAD